MGKVEIGNWSHWGYLNIFAEMIIEKAFDMNFVQLAEFDIKGTIRKSLHKSLSQK